MLSTLLNQPCTITHRAPSEDRDEYGNEVSDLATTTTVCELQQQSRDEQGGQLSDTTWLLVLPAGTPIGTDDTVTVAGADYEVTGDPWHARNPRTRAESHVQATLTRVAAPGDTGSAS